MNNSKFPCVQLIMYSAVHHDEINPTEKSISIIQSFNHGSSVLFIGKEAITLNARCQVGTFAMNTSRHLVEPPFEAKFYRGSWLMWGLDCITLQAMNAHDLMAVANHFETAFTATLNSGQHPYDHMN